MSTQLNNILHYFAVYLNGYGYLGEGNEAKLPNLKVKTEEFRGGGMDQPVHVDLGIEAMECEFKLTSYDPHAFSRFALLGTNMRTGLTFRAHLMGQTGQTATLKANMDVRVMEIDNDSWKAGDVASTTIKMAVDFYELYHGPQQIYQFDPLGIHRVINGVDQLQAARVSLGLATATVNPTVQI